MVRKIGMPVNTTGQYILVLEFTNCIQIVYSVKVTLRICYPANLPLHDFPLFAKFNNITYTNLPLVLGQCSESFLNGFFPMRHCQRAFSQSELNDFFLPWIIRLLTHVSLHGILRTAFLWLPIHNKKLHIYVGVYTHTHTESLY